MPRTVAAAGRGVHALAIGIGYLALVYVAFHVGDLTIDVAKDRLSRRRR